MYSNNCETYNVLKFYSIYVFLGTSKLTDPATITGLLGYTSCLNYRRCSVRDAYSAQGATASAC